MALKNASFTNKGLLKEIKNLSLVVQELQTKVTEAATLANELKADYNVHVHSGITAGSANSGATNSTTAAANVTI